MAGTLGPHSSRRIVGRSKVSWSYFHSGKKKFENLLNVFSLKQILTFHKKHGIYNPWLRMITVKLISVIP